jgi:hypothetical protein
MSPEQATGKAADKRSDLWSFGVVLMEMLTGSPTFPGAASTEIIASVLRNEPDWLRLPGDTPPPVRRLVRRCLQKNRSDRLGDAATARFDIQDAIAGANEAVPAAASTSAPRRHAGRWALIALVVLALAAALALRRGGSEATTASDAIQFTIPAPDKIVVGYTAVSPDGRQVAFMGGDNSGRTSLWVRKFDSLTAQPVAGTNGGTLSFWSPDSRSLAFFVGRQLKRIRVDQGVEELAADVSTLGIPGDGGTWARDGTLLFSLNLDGLYRVLPGSRTAEKFTTLDVGQKETRHYWPSVLPNGTHFMFVVSSGNPDVQGVWLASLKNPADRRRILSDVSKTLYSMGHLLFVRENNLVAQGFNLDTLSMTGEPVPIIEGVPLTSAGGFADFDVSSNGVLSVGTAEAPMRMRIVDRTGRVVQSFGPVLQRYQAIRLSPDRRQVASDAVHPSGYQLFVFDPRAIPAASSRLEPPRVIFRCGHRTAT